MRQEWRWWVSMKRWVALAHRMMMLLLLLLVVAGADDSSVGAE
jgi:hypothetical protein